MGAGADGVALGADVGLGWSYVGDDVGFVCAMRVGVVVVARLGRLESKLSDCDGVLCCLRGDLLRESLMSRSVKACCSSDVDLVGL